MTSEFERLCQEATGLCDENYTVITLRQWVREPDPPYRSLPGWTATIIAYKYPNEARGKLTFGRSGTFEGEWFVLRGKVTPNENDREDEQFVQGHSVHGTSPATPEAALQAALDQLKAKIAAGEWPRGQKSLPPVATLAELLALGTIGLRTGDLAWVEELDGVPPRDSTRSGMHWNGRLVFIRTLPPGEEPNDDTIYAAPSGGFWARARDVP